MTTRKDPLSIESITKQIEKLTGGGKVFVIVQTDEEIKCYKSDDFEISDIIWNFDMIKHSWCQAVWGGKEVSGVTEKGGGHGSGNSNGSKR